MKIQLMANIDLTIEIDEVPAEEVGTPDFLAGLESMLNVLVGEDDIRNWDWKVAK